MNLDVWRTITAKHESNAEIAPTPQRRESAGAAGHSGFTKRQSPMMATLPERAVILYTRVAKDGV